LIIIDHWFVVAPDSQRMSIKLYYDLLQTSYGHLNGGWDQQVHGGWSGWFFLSLQEHICSTYASYVLKNMQFLSGRLCWYSKKGIFVVCGPNVWKTSKEKKYIYIEVPFSLTCYCGLYLKLFSHFNIFQNK